MSTHRRKILGVFLLAMGCASALPTAADPYADAVRAYETRGQVIDGLNMGTDVKAAVARYFQRTGTWPANSREAGVDEKLSGEYVTSIQVGNGTVVIVFGNKAYAEIAGRTVTLRPSLSGDGNVVWGCGYTASPGADPKSGASSGHRTDIPVRFLPPPCQGNNPG